MAFRSALRSMEYDDDQKLDRMFPAQPEPPDYPYGLQFQIDEEDLEKAAGEGGSPGDTLRFSAMAEVTSVLRAENSRIELEICQFAGEDGKFFELKRPACICFCGPELEKLELDDDPELGDTIHLIGEARLESVARTEFMGGSATLQIVALDCAEDESEESRGG